MAVLMSNTIGNIRLIKSILRAVIDEISKFLPSVNYSRDDFVATEEGIYYSF